MKSGAKDLFDPRPKDAPCPIDVDIYSLIKQKKNDDYGATEIAEQLDLEREIVAEAMLSPSWERYSERFS